MNKSIRIKNRLGIWVTVWPISEHFYSIKWDDNPTTVTITEAQLEVLKQYSVEVVVSDYSTVKTNKYGEKYIERNDLMSPEVFADKFYDILCRQTEDALACARRGPDPDYFIGEDADKLIAEYTKAIEYSKGDKVNISELKLTIDAKDIMNSYLEQSYDFLSIVKEFTNTYGNFQVALFEGGWSVYDLDTDVTYKAEDESDLLEIIKSIGCLVEASND